MHSSHKFIAYQDSKGEWRWTFKAANGEPLAVSSEGYKDQSDCLACVRMIQGPDTLAAKLEIGPAQTRSVTKAIKSKRKVATRKKRK